MTRCIRPAGLLVTLLGLASVAWMPGNNWQPVPEPIRAEVASFFASFDQDELNNDADGVMAHLVPNITFQLEAADGTYIRTIDAAIIRQGVTIPPGIDRSTIKHLKRERTDFLYQPGPTDGQFAIRFKIYRLREDETREALPSHEFACVFIRNPGELQIERQIIRALQMEFHGVRSQLLEPPVAPATVGQPFHATIGSPPPIIPRTTPLRPDGPLAESSTVSAGDKLIDDVYSGFRFRVPPGTTVDKTTSAAGTGWTRYRCQMTGDEISIIFDLFPLPRGRGGLSPQQVEDFLALKPANIRQIAGGSELGLQTMAGRQFDVRWYSEGTERPGRPGKAYRWVGSHYALMVSITCRHPEDMDPIVERIFRGMQFPDD